MSAGNTSIVSRTPLHITGSFTADDKTYDGTTAATVLTEDGCRRDGAAGR